MDKELFDQLHQSLQEAVAIASRTLYPHEAAITATTTLQALWGLRREYNLNADSMAMLAMRNLLAADKDRKHLRDLYYYAKGTTSWTMTVPNTGIGPQEYYETLLTKLLQIDTAMLNATGTSGLSGLVVDSKTASIIRSMRSFQATSGYQSIPQPHYAGRLFGMWDIYVDPQGTDYTCLCFGKGRDMGQSAYLAGDAIPAMQFKHAMQPDLQYNNTLWELAYRDLQPFDGREYSHPQINRIFLVQTRSQTGRGRTDGVVLSGLGDIAQP